MAIYGALAEAPAGNNANRKGEYEANGVATVTGSLTITLPIQIRKITNVFATINMATAINSGLDPSLVTVGTISNNTFIIFVWKPTSNSNPTLIASTHAVTVNWLALGLLA
jgi:hypothetical protein